MVEHIVQHIAAQIDTVHHQLHQLHTAHRKFAFILALLCESLSKRDPCYTMYFCVLRLHFVFRVFGFKLSNQSRELGALDLLVVNLAGELELQCYAVGGQLAFLPASSRSKRGLTSLAVMVRRAPGAAVSPVMAPLATSKA